MALPKIAAIGSLGKLRLRHAAVRKQPGTRVGFAPKDEDPALTEAMAIMGSTDRSYVKSLLTMQEKKLPYATLPELVAYKWLQSQRAEFIFQAEAFGGRKQSGGQVPDFVIAQGGAGLVWRIQGEYWHTTIGIRSGDLVDKIRLIGQTIQGLRIETVVDLWENDLYHRMPQVAILAMAGIGLRG